MVAAPVLEHPLPGDADAGSVRYRAHSDVYRPHDDTWLLMEAVVDAWTDPAPPSPGAAPRLAAPRLAAPRLLEVGTGTGIVACAAALSGPPDGRVVATDVNPRAVELALANADLNGVADRVAVARADLARGLRVEAFDLVAFNPPYLPTGPGDGVAGPIGLAVDGGVTGTDVAERFLGDLGDLPGNGPPVLMVASSLQDRAVLEEAAARAGRRLRVEATRKVPWETLTVLRVDRPGPSGPL